MSVKVQIVKRLESLKTSLELDDYDIIDMHIMKLKKENNDNLKEIISMVEQKVEDEKVVKLIDDYIYGYKDSKLTPHQQEVFDNVVNEFNNILSEYIDISDKNVPSNNFIVLSGFAGVGKTFLTSKLIQKFIAQEYKILLTTPTHKSLHVAKYMLNSQNVRVNARTLQSYLDIKLNTNYLTGTKSFQRARNQSQMDFEKNLDILIVDESSMVSNELFKFIEENLEQNKLKTVLFIGDEYQLPPVNNNNDDKALNAVVELPKQYKLTQVVRQAKDSYIKMIAVIVKDCIKNNSYIPINEILNQSKYPMLEIFNEEKSFIESFTSTTKWWEEDKIILSFTNDEVDEFNRTVRYKSWIDQNITPNNAIIPGDILVFNEGYKRTFQNSETITVSYANILYDNNLDIYYYTCKDILGRSFKVIEPDDISKYINHLELIKNEAKIAKENNDDMLRRKKWKYYFTLKEEYAELKYKYASTMHKAQGSTYNTVYIDVASIIGLSVHNKNLAFRLLYVAITRASKNIKILL